MVFRSVACHSAPRQTHNSTEQDLGFLLVTFDTMKAHPTGTETQSETHACRKVTENNTSMRRLEEQPLAG